MGRLYFLANSKSLWSWVGTAITTPVPYSMRTKFARYMGIFSPVRGLMQYEPVNTPSFSRSASVLLTLLCFFTLSIKLLTSDS